MIELTPEHEKFISDQIAQGPFADRAEVVRAALELLRQRLQTDYDETVECIKQGMRDYQDGKGQPLAEACEEIRNSLGLMSSHDIWRTSIRANQWSLLLA